jgi:hypothetical protein
MTRIEKSVFFFFVFPDCRERAGVKERERDNILNIHSLGLTIIRYRSTKLFPASQDVFDFMLLAVDLVNNWDLLVYFDHSLFSVVVVSFFLVTCKGGFVSGGQRRLS